ncbi:putative protein kinase [Candidatus Termititenax aidoneus]|uniref:Uncharacterized protein n=1 Tax=Termititenax aidoneus TaxID=2218524 RepID=A0A388TBM1_TERA1|nr:putative protein kinase [Candidatus Termititenax aidoneus]
MFCKHTSIKDEISRANKANLSALLSVTHSMSKRAGNDIPFDALRSMDRPLLQNNVQNIVDDLVSDYCRQDTNGLPEYTRQIVEKNIAVLKRQPFAIYLSDALAPNAFCHRDKRIIYLNIGLLRNILETDMALCNWDTVAFILAHEISHMLYAENGLIEIADQGKYENKHDMENQCDRDALVMMDLAGFNVNFADFSVLGVSIDSQNLGILQSHPNNYTRQQSVRQQVYDLFWQNYAENSVRPFTPQEIAEINQATPLENAVFRTQRANDIVSVLLGCFGALLHYQVDAYLNSERKWFRNIEHLYRFIENMDFLEQWPYTVPELVKDFEVFCLKYKNELDALAAKANIATNTEQYRNLAMYIFYTSIRNNYIGGSENIEPTDIAAQTLMCIDGLLQTADLHPESRKIFQQIFERMILNEIKAENQNTQTSMECLLEIQKFLEEICSLISFDLENTLNVSNSYGAVIDLFKNKLIEIISANLPKYLRGRAEHNVYFEVFDLLFYNFQIEITMPQLEAEYAVEYAQGLIRENDQYSLQRFMKSLTLTNYVAVMQNPLIQDYIVNKIADFTFLASIGGVDRIADGFTFASLIELCKSDKLCTSIKASDFDGGSFFLYALKYKIDSDQFSPDELALLWQERQNLLEAVVKYSVSAKQQSQNRAFLAQLCSAILRKQRARISIDEYKFLFGIFPHPDILAGKKFAKLIAGYKTEELLEILNSCYQIEYDPISIYMMYIWRSKPQILITEICKRFDCNYTKKTFRVNYAGQIYEDYPTLSKPLENETIEMYAGIPDAVLEAILAHGDYEAVGCFLPFYIHKLSISGRLSAETVLRVSRLYSAKMTIKLEWNKRLASEFLGYNISLRDCAYLIYFGQNGYGFLQDMSVSEALVWLEKYMPDKSPYRDIVLNKVFKSRFADLANRETQLHVIELFKNKRRALEMLAVCYEQHSGDFPDLAAKINFLNVLYPAASPEKDLLLEEIFSGQSFALSEYNYYLPLFSNFSRNYQKQESIGRGTLGVRIENYAAADKTELVLWLTGKQKDKPLCLVKDENSAMVLLDETKDLFALSQSYRSEMLRGIFAGNKGLFSPNNTECLRQLLDALFAGYLAGNNSDSADDTKLKSFTRTVIHELFKLDNDAKKLRILTNIFKSVYASPDQTLNTAEFIKIVLASYGVIGVKLAQILASQKELEKTYPQLYNALKNLKDKASPMSIAEALNALNRNPSLRERDIIVRECQGAASIKSVFSAEINGEEKIIKIRRASANKDIQKEQKEFQQLLRNLIPDLQNIFGLKSVPDYSERIFNTVREEVNFAVERGNADKLRAVLSKMNNKNVEFRVPYIEETLSDENVLVETIAAGVPLAEYRKTATDAENEQLNQILQKAILEQIFKYGYFHADPHDGNVFIKRKNGKYIITFIDVGLCGKLAENSTEAKFFKGLILAAVKKDRQPQDYLNLFRTILGVDYQTYAAALGNRVKEDLLNSQPENIAVTIVNILDSLPGYRVPDSIVQTLLAVSKTPYLYKHYKANIPLYLELFGFNLLFGH